MVEMARMVEGYHRGTLASEIRIPAGDVTLTGALTLPDHAVGLALVICRVGEGRVCLRSRVVARRLEAAGFGTLVIDLLAYEETAASSRPMRFDTERLAQRLAMVTHAMRQWAMTRDLPIGYYSSGTRAAAALMAAAIRPDDVLAVVSRGGRADLAISTLPKIRAATMLITAPDEHALEQINRQAMTHLRCEKRLEIASGADAAADLTTRFFQEHVAAAVAA